MYDSFKIVYFAGSTKQLLKWSFGSGLTRASMPLSIIQTGHKNHLLSTAEKGKWEDNILLQGGWCRHSSLYVRHLLCCSHWRSSCHSTWSQCYGVPSNTAFNNFLASSILIFIFVAICMIAFKVIPSGENSASSGWAVGPLHGSGSGEQYQHPSYEKDGAHWR